MRVALFLLSLLLLAGCGGSSNSSTPVVSATAVAAVPPPAGKTWLEVVTKTADGNYIQGNANAPIHLVEYGSRTCPVCGAFAHNGVDQLRAKYVATGKVSYEYRDFLIHPQDSGVALLGHCVPTEAFFVILDQMYAGQDQFNAIAEQMPQDQVTQIQAMPRLQAGATWAQRLGYIDFMKQRGYPEAKINACLNDQAELKAINDHMQKAADEKNVSGTPTFLINDQVVPNTVSFDRLEPALQAAGAR